MVGSGCGAWVDGWCRGMKLGAFGLSKCFSMSVTW